MYDGILHVSCKRNPLIPVCLVLVYIMCEALSQHTVAPVNTSLRFRMKRRRLNFLNLKHLASVSKYLTNEDSALISLWNSRCAYFNTMFATKALATVTASCWPMGTATTYLLRSSWNVRLYFLFPCVTDTDPQYLGDTCQKGVGQSLSPSAPCS